MSIVILVFVLLVVIYLLINAFSKSSQLTKMMEAKKPQTIKADQLKNANNSSNFTYSMWIYVDDWNYNFGNPKTVLNRKGGPTVVLGDKPNTVTTTVNYYDKGKTPPGALAGGANNAAPLSAEQQSACDACSKGYTCACAACNGGVALGGKKNATTSAQALANAASRLAVASKSVCTIDNVPIQKWVNIIISLYGRTLDTYLDGKLVRTCVLPGVPQIDNNADVQVTPGGGFSGYTTTFKYWPNASNPQEAYNIYKDGFGGSILGNLFNQYRLRFSFIKDNKELGGFEL